MQLLSASIIRQICDEHGIRPTKTLGQNFMVDSGQVKKIVKAAKVEPDERILEIGPGLGSLTLGLLEVGAFVTAVEIDRKLAELLPVTAQSLAPKAAEKLEVLNMDALDLKMGSLTHFESAALEHRSELSGELPDRLVANLPYSVGTQIFLNILERFPTIKSATILVQAEVAERITAEPGSKTYGIPSVKTAWFGKATLGATIPRSAFFPVPRVDSKLVHFERKPMESPKNLLADRESTFSLINLGFSGRRKTLRSLLVADGYNSDSVRDALDSLQIDPLIRAEKLSVQQFAELAAKL